MNAASAPNSGAAARIAEAGATVVERQAEALPGVLGGGYFLQVIASLLLVLLCLAAVIWLLRRFNRIGGGPGGPVAIIGAANVGQRERVMLIEAGGEQILIGVAPGSVRKLHVLASPVPAPAQVAGSFSTVLKSLHSAPGQRS